LGSVILGIVCAILGAVALIVSWAAAGQVRLVAGLASAVLGPLGLWIAAALWYGWRLDQATK